VSQSIEKLAELIAGRIGVRLVRRACLADELSYDVAASDLIAVATALRDDTQLRFEMLMDVTAVDYLDYGRSEWRTVKASSNGFGRGVTAGTGGTHDGPRFAVLYQFLSIANNERLTLRSFCIDGDEPLMESLVPVFASANWFEREVFDLFGILFPGHPDLRRLLTDYGFIGHPFRKDFPLEGNVEVRYDEAKGRVVYEPVEITPRTLVPKVIRDDARYDPALTEAGRG
jgi:NADH-quinone oxidoreductase subunit C